MEMKSYPPRIRLEVVQIDKFFFQNRQHLKFSLGGGSINFCRDIAIPITHDAAPGMYVGYTL